MIVRTFHEKNMKKGFTLIELLIVIGILGILAAGLLAAIDPLDQLRRGRDSAKRNISVELVNAANRYYASRGSMPWGTAEYGPSASTGQLTATIQQLITANELKSTFLSGLPTAGNALYLYSDTNQNTYSCVQQEARAVNINSIYLTNTGNTGAAVTCVGGTGTTACYYCAR